MKTIGSLFAGIGGFDLGFERAGFKTTWACEIDQKAQSVLRLRFPDAKLHDDVCQIGAHNLEPVDVVTFGSPCQDLSVAGKRAGLAGERSGLFHEAVRVIRELREQHGKPDFAIWENVPGAFSSNQGRDFAAVIDALADIGARDIAWRVLDSRFFGVAQRRRRVFLVASFGNDRGASEVLFEQESGDGSPSQSGAKDASAFARSDETVSGIKCLEHDCDWDVCGCFCADDTRCPWCDEWTSGLYYNAEQDGLSCCKAWFRKTCGTLSDGAHMGGGTNGQDAISGRVIVDNHGIPRRLTPVECSRLQGFPDDWNSEGIDKTGKRIQIADGPRYRQLGNAVTVNVANWIANNLAAVYAAPKESADGEP